MNTEVKKWIEEDGESFLEGIDIKKGQFVLDFGCGEGHYTIPASKIVGTHGKIYALDKDKEALNRLAKMIKNSSIKNIELIKEDSKIPLEDNSLDAVLCYDVIHYENKKKRIAIYNEIYTVLKEGGLFSVYPKHHKEDYPLMELADTSLESIVREIEDAGFVFESKFQKNLLHDENYNKGYILNFKRGKKMPLGMFKDEG
jgi:ubiquinone/menaquinone biosynthesis C-methylase UbiE